MRIANFEDQGEMTMCVCVSYCLFWKYVFITIIAIVVYCWVIALIYNLYPTSEKRRYHN